MTDSMIVDAFAGPGGWSEGLALLGRSDLGLEWDAAACATRAAAGHRTIRCDVAEYPPEVFAGRVDGLILSPPCPDFSLAGKGAGIEGVSGRLIRQVPRWVEAVRPRWFACEQVPPALAIWQLYARQLAALGYSTWCGVLNAADFGVGQTRRRAFLLGSTDRLVQPPEPTHCRGGAETLFGRLEPWRSMAEVLGWGMPVRPYFTIAPGHADALALGGASSREAVHAEAEAGRWVVRTGANSEQGGGTLIPYERGVEEPAPTVDGKAGHSWVVTTRGSRPPRAEGGVGGNHFDPEARPSWALTSKVRDWTVDRRQTGAPLVNVAVEPAPTITGAAFGRQVWKVRGPVGDEEAMEVEVELPEVDDPGPEHWGHGRPATTLMGDARVFRPDHHGDGRPSQAVGAIHITVPEALLLQGFRPDYPVQGPRTKQFEQVGNAVPPPVAAAVLAQLL